MAIIQPPITDNMQLDSWTRQLTAQINAGLLPGIGGVGGGAGGSDGIDGSDGNSAFYLYIRTTSRTSVPSVPTLVTYDFTNSATPTATADNGWTREIPEDVNGPYLWVTFRYISDKSGTITDSNTWDAPKILGVPNFSYSVDVVGFDFLKSSTTSITLSAVSMEFANDTSREITDLLNVDNIYWTRNSILSAEVDYINSQSIWADQAYSVGDKVRHLVSLHNNPNLTFYYVYECINNVSSGAGDPSVNSAGWRMENSSQLKQQDDIWTFPIISTTNTLRASRREGTDVVVNNNDVENQTQFIAHLNDDLSELP